MDNRNYDFTTLSERISAQTQAYVEFSNALVKIIEQTASIRDSVSENNTHLLEDYRQLNNKFQTLLIDLNKFFNENTSQHNNIERDLESIKTALSNYENKLKELIDEMEDNNSKLFGMIETIIKNSKEDQKSLAIETAENHTSMETLVKQISQQNDLIVSFTHTVNKFKVFFWAASALITILGVLSQFGILKILWFAK
jgi:seryl-tRNA synthetase